MQALETSDMSGRAKLEPIQSEDGSTELLRIEIERLQGENQRLEASFKHYENQVSCEYLFNYAPIHSKV